MLNTLMKLRNKKGFTLMEMLIVVAIIAILVAIAIPTLTGALEKAREATDLANLRAAYADIIVKYLNNETSDPIVVPTTQSNKTWAEITTPKVGDITVVAAGAQGWTVSFDSGTGAVSIAAKDS